MKLRLALSAILLILWSGIVSAQETTQENGWLRFAHFSADAPAIDIYVDEEMVFENVAYKTVTNYISISPTQHTVRFVETGGSLDQTLLEPVTLPFAADETYLLGVAGLIADANLQLAAVQESRTLNTVLENNPQMGTMEDLAGFIMLHGLSRGPSIALITQTGEIITTGLEFSNLYISPVNQGRYPLLITTSDDGNAVIFDELNPFTFSAGVNYLVAIVGTVANPELVVQSSGMKTLDEIISDADGVNAFARAIEITGQVEELSTGDPFTVFVPTNDAFGDAPIDMNTLLNDPEALRGLLNYHIVEGDYDIFELQEVETLTTLSGETLEITVNPLEGENFELFLNGEVAVNTLGIQGLNGRIYLVDHVLVPPAP